VFTDRSLPLEPSHLPRRFLQGVLVPVNASARSYHPVLGADVDVFEREVMPTRQAKLRRWQGVGIAEPPRERARRAARGPGSPKSRGE